MDIDPDAIIISLLPPGKPKMHQRGITLEEIQQTLNEGWEATDAKPGTSGRVMVFRYEAEGKGSSTWKKR